MQVLYRFIQAVTATITPVYADTIQIGDKFTDVLRKLQGVLMWRNMRTSITSAVTGGASTTSDIAIATLTIPANSLVSGDTIAAKFAGIMTRPISIGNPIHYWVKINGTKVAINSNTPTSAQTDKPIWVEFITAVYSVGASGEMYTTGRCDLNITSTPLPRMTSGSSITVSTTATITVTLGFNFNNSNGSNKVTANVATIRVE